MGILDGILGGVIGSDASKVLKEYVEKHGGLEGVTIEFERAGFGQKVKSWVSTGPNLPITPEELQHAIHPNELVELSRKFDIPVIVVGELLARSLPIVVEKATVGGGFLPGQQIGMGLPGEPRTPREPRPTPKK
jgi:uncharacterized protein YidB (DUF937 family)